MKRVLAIILTFLLVLGLAACGNSTDSSSETSDASDAQTSSEDESSEEVSGDGIDATVDYDALSGTKISVACSPAPHAEILKVAAELLKEKNITLDIQEYDDYIIPNNVVEDGTVDANFFQHVPYLDDFNAENGTHLVAAAGIHVEPMALYGGKADSLDTIPDGAQIAVPNDTTNEARALLLLEANGLITLDENAGIGATKNDIVENPHNIDIVEAEAAQLPNILQDVEYAVINSNYAIDAGLNPLEDGLVIENSESEYVNVLVVKEGNEETDATKALIAALTSEKVREFINEEYGGSVVPVF